MTSSGRDWEFGEFGILFRGLRSFMRIVLNTDEIPFDVVTTRFGEFRAKARSRKLANAFRDVRHYLEICFPENEWRSPDIDLFVKCFLSFVPIQRCVNIDPSEYQIGYGLEGQIFNDFVAYIREEAKRRGVKKAMRDWLYGATTLQQGNIKAYLRTMPNCTTKLMLVRADLLYRANAVSPDGVMRRLSVGGFREAMREERLRRRRKGKKKRRGKENRARFDVVRAMQHRTDFLENRDGKDKEFFKHLIGYVWKVAQSEKGLLHHHVLFIFDAQCVQSDFRLLELAGQRWNDITNGAGFLHSTHFKKKELMEKGAWYYGKVSCHDAEALERAFIDASGYFTEERQLLCFKPLPHSQTLTKGLPHKPRVGGPGRPRKCAARASDDGVPEG
ncbi:hypothetical protein BLA34_12350 [Ralstonia solanacearum]|nr:hypothetical protein BLA34_12350 [Ralstonia solanacearum]